MTPFFNTPEKIAVLQFHAALWIGTPFMPNAAIRGEGVSCQKLVASIYRECGVINFEAPEGPMDWAHANKRSLIAEYMATLPQFAEVVIRDGRASGLPGDMLGFKMGGCIHHTALLIAPGQFIHCLRGYGTRFASLADTTYGSRLEKIWRPICQ